MAHCRALRPRFDTALGQLDFVLEVAQWKPEKFEALAGEDELTKTQAAIALFCFKRRGPIIGLATARALTREQIYLDLRERLKMGLQAYLHDPRGWAINARLVRDAATGEGHIEFTGNAIDLFVGRAAELVLAEGARLAECARPDCGTLFIRRKRGVYCSKRCASYTKTMNYRRRHPDKVNELRRAAYRRQVKEKKPGIPASEKRSE